MNEETAPIYIVSTDAEAEQLANERIRPSLPTTPETDAARVSVDTYAGEYLVDADPRGRWVEATFAEKLERERDEARRGWRTMETAPKDGTEIIVLFDSASVDIVRLCWWDEGSPKDEHLAKRTDEIGWWSYKHSVTQELMEPELYEAIGWMPHPGRN